MLVYSSQHFFTGQDGTTCDTVATVLYTTYKFRLYPTDDQAKSLTQMFGAQRALWNVALQQRIDRLKYPKSSGEYPNFYSQCLGLTELRADCDWIRAVTTDFQQLLLRDLDKAWSSFLGKSRGIPRFKSKYRNPITGLTSNTPIRLKFTHFHAWVPTLGWVKMRSHRRLKGRPVKMTVSLDVDQWFVSITTELQDTIVTHPHPTKAVGLDMGVTHAVTDSDGNHVPNPRFLAKLAKRMRLLQRRVSRKKKLSNNRRKAVNRVAKLHQHIRRSRQNWQHNLTAKYTKSHGMIVVEKLMLSNMTKSARGTVDEPGVNVKAKSGLNRSLLDVGMYEIKRQLAYKCERDGGKLIQINPGYTSQTCSQCGYCSPENRKTQSLFHCQQCGYKANADVNAACNVLNAGTAPVYACGGHKVTVETGTIANYVSG